MLKGFIQFNQNDFELDLNSFTRNIKKISFFFFFFDYGLEIIDLKLMIYLKSHLKGEKLEERIETDLSESRQRLFVHLF